MSITLCDASLAALKLVQGISESSSMYPESPRYPAAGANAGSGDSISLL